MFSDPIAPFSGSLWTPTMMAVSGGGEAPDEHAAIAARASAPLLNRAEGGSQPLGWNELGEAEGLLAVALEKDHDRKTLLRAVLRANSGDLGVVVIGGVHVKRDEPRALLPDASVRESLLVELLACAAPARAEVDEQRFVLGRDPCHSFRFAGFPSHGRGDPGLCTIAGN
jgi:hypothetical protein